jgi:hypothetical protein
VYISFEKPARLNTSHDREIRGGNGVDSKIQETQARWQRKCKKERKKETKKQRNKETKKVRKIERKKRKKERNK